ncbi:conjugal transfer protein TrbE [Asticcacaulis sp. BYS171W]|uniref:Conjugal transfer protein TrbE n=1 Tax=Asticcacaulis aquaticus TaxID=2984212 RepID=A0ABT5HPZ3_9CAUL|nr:conjugal transfer protein TrbE [Asticcacaulis aquaticus]MDC7682137.1 conjugal transfer protein TrbE [Asticcacaulis aquaticus]
MLNLRQYRQTADRLADHLPWAVLAAPGVVLNKDGSFQRTARYEGPDVESATPEELVALSARLNNVFRRLGSGWAVFFDARRGRAQAYPGSGAETGLGRLIDEERRAAFAGEEGHHFESRYHLTLVYMPPADQLDGMGEAFVEREEKVIGRDWHDVLRRFVDRTDAVFDLLATVLPYIRALDDADTLTYLHACVSTKAHPVAMPETPVYLDAILVDTPLSGGLEPRLGDQHLRSLTLLGFPNNTRPAMLDALNHLDMEYRWTTRFIALDKAEAVKTLTKLRRQWFAKRKSVAALMREVLYKEASALTDTDADNKVADVDLALQAIGGDHVGFGYLTTTLSVMGPDRDTADERLRQVERVINGLGFTAIAESLNAVEAWLGSIPGHLYANVRQPLIHTLNLGHLAPMSTLWAGPERNRHLDGPALFHAVSSGATPFRFSTHVGDVGHMLVLGPTGAGKSVLLAFMAVSFTRYPDAQVFVFDKGGSARAAVLALSGSHHEIGRDGQVAFQPLRHIDDYAERTWALDWLSALLDQQGFDLSLDGRDALWAALETLAGAPVEQRTLTGLCAVLAFNDIKVALRPYTLDGPYGHILDADHETLELTAIHGFEMESLMGERLLVAPVLTYLFHRLEARFDGRPTLMILDEAWVFLDHPLFAARIREWLKVLRKKNVSVLFATQSLADVVDSPIAPVLIESFPQRLFLPNERAVEPQSRGAYQRLGLNDRQITLIGQATPKRQYYLQSRRGNRLFDLRLGQVALSICAASSPDDQRLIDTVLAEGPPETFAARYLTARGLSWAGTLLAVTDPPSVG